MSSRIGFFYRTQGLFYVCSQPTRDSVTLLQRLSLDGCKPSISPGILFNVACTHLLLSENWQIPDNVNRIDVDK